MSTGDTCSVLCAHPNGANNTKNIPTENNRLMYVIPNLASLLLYTYFLRKAFGLG